MWKRLILAGILLVVVGGACFACFVVGAVVAERGAYHRRYVEERRNIDARFQRKPEYAKIEIKERSDGGAWLLGSVKSEEQLAELRLQIVQAVGESRAEEALGGVTIQ